jgi:drug/metabolite transporter (DMT)-like permease
VGTGFLFGKLVLPDLSVSHLILYRLVFACAGFIVVLAGRWTTVGRDDWPLVLLAGVVGVPLVYLIQFEGLARTTVAHASLMVGAMPILLGLAAAVIARERLTLRHWILLLVSASGALLIASGPNEPGDSGRGPSVVGDALVLLSLLAAVAWVLTSKRLMARYNSGFVSALVQIVGTVMLIAWVVPTAGLPPFDLPLRVWLIVGAQGLLATTTATLLWNWGIVRVPMSEAGVFVNLEPVVGALLGVIVLGEHLGWTGVLGGVLIVGAAVAVTRK